MINKAKELNEALKNTPEAKEYLKLKQEIENDTYINQLLERINQTQHLMKDYLKNNQMDDYKKCKIELKIYEQEFMNNPLIHNYIVIKNEVYQTIEQVVNILSEE